MVRSDRAFILRVFIDSNLFKFSHPFYSVPVNESDRSYISWLGNKIIIAHFTQTKTCEWIV